MPHVEHASLGRRDAEHAEGALVVALTPRRLAGEKPATWRGAPCSTSPARLSSPPTWARGRATRSAPSAGHRARSIRFAGGRHARLHSHHQRVAPLHQPTVTSVLAPGPDKRGKPMSRSLRSWSSLTVFMLLAVLTAF